MTLEYYHLPQWKSIMALKQTVQENLLNFLLNNLKRKQVLINYKYTLDIVYFISSDKVAFWMKLKLYYFFSLCLLSVPRHNGQ